MSYSVEFNYPYRNSRPKVPTADQKSTAVGLNSAERRVAPSWTPRFSFSEIRQLVNNFIHTEVDLTYKPNAVQFIRICLSEISE
jgi:hypothetical protein